MQIAEILLYSQSISVFTKTDCELNKKDKVVVNYNGSLELGIVKNILTEGNFNEVADFVRVATKEDDLIHCENCKYSKQVLPQIKEEAKKLKLNMKIGFIGINHDKTKLIVNYTAEERVDFRELLKVLNNKFKMRIEMRQIGNRDEAKMIGALGCCGRVTCCNLFLSDFDKVSIKMAKNQNLALNPNRINGMCGRLLCCLKYEDDFYDEMQKKMPKIGFKVKTNDGEGQVTAVDFLKENVTVTFTKNDTTEVKIYNYKDVKWDKK